MLVISVLMPVKNTATFLNECLDSVLNQTEKKWELIAVDDSSTDASFTILKKYAQQDNRIKVYANKGKGIIAALQLAYAKSSGNLISRMDSDDVMNSNKLQILKQNLLIKGRGHLALGLVNYFSEAGVGDGFKRYEEWLNNLTLKGNNFDDIYKECVIPSPCWMVYKDDFEMCGAFNSFVYPEDYDLCFRFYEKRLKCIATDKIVHQWRDYPTRTSRTDKHYMDNSFLDIKTDYFLKLHYHKNRPLVLWGAGKKGKTFAKKMIKKGINFNWVCDNPNKLGRDIYGQKLVKIEVLEQLQNPQSIITVANPHSQKVIKKYLESKGFKAKTDYFFFC